MISKLLTNVTKVFITGERTDEDKIRDILGRDDFGDLLERNEANRMVDPLSTRLVMQAA